MALYRPDVYTVKRFGVHKIKIVYSPGGRPRDVDIPDDLTPVSVHEDKSAEKGLDVNEAPFVDDNGKTEKFAQSLSRSRSHVVEYGLCNPWSWFVTLTIDPSKYDRYNLAVYVDDLTEFIHNYNRRRNEDDKVRYLLIPELHPTSGAWHMHGLIKGIADNDIYVNKYGYYTWRQYEDKFGFISMSRISDLDRTVTYITKYISKDLGKALGPNDHTYYCSRGLKVAELIFKGTGAYCGSWDWVHPDGYCKIAWLDDRHDDLSELLTPLPPETDNVDLVSTPPDVIQAWIEALNDPDPLGGVWKPTQLEIF